MNQCDGCSRGLRLIDGIHWGEEYDMIGCTAHLYEHSATGECARCEERYTQNAADKGMALNRDGICRSCKVIEEANWRKEP